MSSLLEDFRSSSERLRLASVLSSQNVQDSGLDLSWEIEDQALGTCLKTLYNGLKDRRGPFDIKKPGDLASDVDVMSAVCRRLAGQRPHLFTEEGALTLELECCALVTSPPVTGLILRLETYGMFLLTLKATKHSFYR